MTTTNDQRQCAAITNAGKPCRGAPLPGSDYCFSHDPELAETRRAAREKGGRNRSNMARARAMAPRRLVPVYDQLEAALEGVLKGSVTPAKATAAASVARALVALLQAGELEERLRRIEADVEARSDR